MYFIPRFVIRPLKHSSSDIFISISFFIILLLIYVAISYVIRDRDN